MGNLIGNYIHYHKSNYIRYGIGVKTPNKHNYTYHNYRGKLLKQYKNNKISEFCKRYEITLNEWYNGTDNVLKIQKQYRAKQENLKEKINTTLLNQLNNSTAKVKVTNNGFDLSGGNKISANKTYNKKQVASMESARSQKIMRQTIENYIADLNSIFSHITSYKNATEPIVKNQLIKIEKTKTLLNNILKNNPGVKTFYLDKSATLTKVLSSVVACYEYDFALGTAQDKGDIGEVAGAYAAVFVANNCNISLDKVHDIINKKVVLTGKTTSSPRLNTDNNKKNKVFSSRYTLGYSTWDMVQKETQNKADIIVTYGNEPMKISFKNYSENGISEFGIKTTTGSSLLTYIVDEDTNFINHWINTTVIANRNEGNDEDSMLDAKRKTYHNIMKLIILLKSIRGAAGRQHNANIFAFNLRSGGKNAFKVYSLYDIIEKMSLTERLQGVIIQGYEDRIVQNWRGHSTIRSTTDAAFRINEIMSRIKQAHLNVHFNAKSGLF